MVRVLTMLKTQFLQMNHAKLRDDRMVDCWTVTTCTCMYGTAKMKGFNVLTYLWFKPYVVTIYICGDAIFNEGPTIGFG